MVGDKGLGFNFVVVVDKVVIGCVDGYVDWIVLVFVELNVGGYVKGNWVVDGGLVEFWC